MDAIPNSEFSRECPNEKCKHMNLRWRILCVICGTPLPPVKRTESERHEQQG